jgi:hypothetical protein
MFGNGIALQGLVFAPTLLRREGGADPMELMLKAKSDGRIVRTLHCSVFVLITPPDGHPAGLRQVSALVTHLEISADTTVRVAILDPLMSHGFARLELMSTPSWCQHAGTVSCGVWRSHAVYGGVCQRRTWGGDPTTTLGTSSSSSSCPLFWLDIAIAAL